LATGDFGLKQVANSNKVGVAQVMSRQTYVSGLSHLRRVTTPIDKSGKLVQPRKLDNSQWGFLCPSETPEGQSVGVVKNISYMTHITIYNEPCGLYEYVKSYIIPIEKATLQDISDNVKLFINGTWVGVTTTAVVLYNYLKTLKYKGIINIYTSIYFDYHNKEIYICNDAGRVVRPIYRVKDNKLLLTDDIITKLKYNELNWDDLLLETSTRDSVLEYIDPDEQNSILIAMKPEDLMIPSTSTSIYRFTHCEIHPSTIFGILASCIPFPEKNQSPRNTYQCAMGKQAMGMYVSNYDSRLDKTSYVLTYPHRPLVDTRIMNLLNLNKIPSGIPVIVAIKSDTGYNQEDSIQFNEGSIKRGLFQAVIYNTDKDEEKNMQGDDEIRGRPDPNKTKGIKFGNYNKVNDQGLIPENTLVENQDVYMAKYMPIKENKNDHTKIIKFQDHSKVFRTHEETYIDKNFLSRNGDGYAVCKVRTRVFRQPVIGDKFSSRHGQKGTIGNIIPEADMPFTESGVRPDIIINPHAIPSRMTIAQLKETLLGKVLLELGMFGDGTSFSDMTVEFLTEELLKLGYEKHGNELLYDGVTGIQHASNIFMGPVFYQRLKHMVDDKLHSRAIGPMVNLTRQPAEGRSKDGGLRFGEMERDCMIAHGASRFTKDRIYDVSDKYVVYSCKQCGNIASYNDKTHIHICKMCDNRTDFAKVNLPYSCKLLFQELMTMNVFPRMITK
jgi:DNA-directed RNA polymerase II subunit RPB2